MKRSTCWMTALIIAGTMATFSCTNDKPSSDQPLDTQELTKNQPEVHGNEVKAEDVKLTTPLNADWIASGKATYELKCQGCHKLTNEKLVGPGWAGITQKREPHWILNMITNVDVMLEKDPEAQKLLEECLVRMPNQNITKEQAREVLEFMRSNDGVK